MTVFIFKSRKIKTKGYGFQGYELEKLFNIQHFEVVLSVILGMLLVIYSQI